MNRGWYFASGLQKNSDVNMNSAISMTRIGKEKRDATLQSGENMKHPYNIKKIPTENCAGCEEEPGGSR